MGFCLSTSRQHHPQHTRFALPLQSRHDALMQSLLSRLIWLPVTWWGAVTLTFALLRLTPGDPLDALLGDNANVTARAEMAAALGLDQPWYQQYFTFWSDLLRGDWGVSFMNQQPVLTQLLERIPATLELACVAIIIALLLALPAGIWAAREQGQRTDNWLQNVTGLALVLPSFVLGPWLLLLFALWWPVFPVGGRGELSQVILPALTLAIPLAALLQRQLRSALIENARHDFALTAAAKGCDQSRVWWRHILPNSLAPVLTVLFLQLGVLITGTIIVETIFQWPGVGQLLVDSLNHRDYPLIQGTVLFIALGYSFATVLNDLVQLWLDPRRRG